ncbi:hypothetical protein FO519_006620 [Halicephalobus sp. NKZ332]|nr:hypothetical protein FO519_006620 [Halicephalobus sp. NKZ332]
MSRFLLAVLGVALTIFSIVAMKEFPEILKTDSEHTAGIKKALQKINVKEFFGNKNIADTAAVPPMLPNKDKLRSLNLSGLGNHTCKSGYGGPQCESRAIIYPMEMEIGMRVSVYTYEFTPPGSYLVQLNADDPTGSFLVTYNAWTYLDCKFGGVIDDGNTARRNDFPTFNLTFPVNTSVLFMTTPVGLDFPGSLDAVYFTYDQLKPHPLLLRYGCHYPYYILDFSCPDKGFNIIKVHGFDFRGYPFIRIYGYICEEVIGKI